MRHCHIGSDFDSFLEGERILSESTATAIKRVLAYQVREYMERQKITKTAFARKMKTSRSSLDRLLDPDNVSVTLLTVEKAANALGKSLKIEIG